MYLQTNKNQNNVLIIFHLHNIINLFINQFTMKAFPVILLSVLMLIAANCKTYDPLSHQITLHGRYYVENGKVNYDWSCFKIDFCFINATKVQWHVVDTWNIYHVILDQKNTTKIQPHKNQLVTVFQSVQPQSHCIEIVKITENHYGPIASHRDSIFGGIQTNGDLFKKQKIYSYKFDFLGDSLSTAFGVMSGTNPVCFMKMKQIQNCLQSWAVHLSKMFNADYRIQAVSGKGVVQNAAGVPGPKMPSLFGRTSDNSKPFTYKYQDKYIPDALFLLIGANDYNNIKNPSRNKFTTGYQQMLMKIARDQMTFAKYGIKIICICDIQFNKQLCLNIKTAVKEFGYGYQFVYYVQIPEGVFTKDKMGCIGHPNALGQRTLASSIYEQVKLILNK